MKSKPRIRVSSSVYRKQAVEPQRTRKAATFNFLKFHLGIEGRLNRLSYFYVLLICWLLILAGYLFLLVLIEIAGEVENWNIIGQVFYWIFCVTITLPSYWCMFTSTIKRLHDMNRSGAWLFALAVIIFLPIFMISSGEFPLEGVPEMIFMLSVIAKPIVILIVIICPFCFKGTKGANQYGEDPKEKLISKVLLGE